MPFLEECVDIRMNTCCMAVQSVYGRLPVRASFYYLKEDKKIDYIPDDESIAAFRQRLSLMIMAVCAGESVAGSPLRRR